MLESKNILSNIYFYDKPQLNYNLNINIFTYKKVLKKL